MSTLVGEAFLKYGCALGANVEVITKQGLVLFPAPGVAPDYLIFGEDHYTYACAKSKAAPVMRRRLRSRMDTIGGMLHSGLGDLSAARGQPGNGHVEACLHHRDPQQSDYAQGAEHPHSKSRMMMTSGREHRPQPAQQRRDRRLCSGLGKRERMMGPSMMSRS